jgi:hypothetical protein
METDRALGSFFVHRHTGKILRVLRVGRLGYQVVVEGLGRLMLSRRALHASYARAAVRMRSRSRSLAERTRELGALRLTLRSIRHGHELCAESDDPPRTERLRFAEAAQALYWFEALETLADLRALLSVASFTG